MSISPLRTEFYRPSGFPTVATLTLPVSAEDESNLNFSYGEGIIMWCRPPIPFPLDTTPQAAAFKLNNAAKYQEVILWRGIRYAQPPIGDLAFKPAQPFIYPGGQIVDLSQVPNVPHQTFMGELAGEGRPEFGMPEVGTWDWKGMGATPSDDCLTLSVFKPAGATTLLPILFWIHGGAWVTNSQLGWQHWAHRFAANHRVIVVVPGYRLSTRGHFPHPLLMEDGEPSVAYTDVRCALKWTYDNAHLLGGQRDNITAAGTSAGGAAVQHLATDPEAKPCFVRSIVGSGGGAGRQMQAQSDAAGLGYTYRTRVMEKAIEGLSPILSSAHPTYTKVSDAIEVEGFGWAMQHAVRGRHIEQLADIRLEVTPASVRSALRDTGSLAAFMRTESENLFPFRRDQYMTRVDAAKDGAFDKPTIFFYSAHEAMNLLGGSTVASLRAGLQAVPIPTLDSWSHRLGYESFAAWKLAGWKPPGGLGSLSTSLFPAEIDDTEERLVLYTHAFFAWPAWRIAYEMSKNGVPVHVICGNFSANGQFAGHSTEVPMYCGTVEWLVGQQMIDGEIWANVNMDAIYVWSIYSTIIGRYCWTGDPNDASMDPVGYNLWSDPATHPADGGQITATVVPFDWQDGRVNVLGKWFGDPADEYDEINERNAWTQIGPLSHRDARMQLAPFDRPAFQDYLARTGI